MNPGGFKVCKFALKRVPGQPPLPTRPVETDAAAEETAEDNEAESEGGDEATAEDTKDEPSQAAPLQHRVNPLPLNEWTGKPLLRRRRFQAS